MRTPQRWRQATVWVHVVTSVGWMAQAFALMTMTIASLSTEDRSTRRAALEMAHVLDGYLLAPMANAAALTGLVLAAGTAWGFFRHWWVLAKFAMTLGQLYAGIFLLSPALGEAVAATAAGQPVPRPGFMIAGAALMGTGLATQVWLSVAKPWGRTSWSAAGKPPSAPAWVFVAGALVPLADVGVAAAVGGPMPLLSLIALTAVLVARLRAQRLAQAVQAHV